jgi:pentatricopeptide repeat domain-containing protein 1
VISACEKGGEWARALKLLSAMVQLRVERETITHNAAINACEKRGE